MLPLIPTWMVHWMLNVPFVLKVRVIVVFWLLPISATPLPALKTTLCVIAVNTKLTVPPCASVTAFGSNDVPGMLIVADVAGGGGVPGAETVITRVPLTPPAEAEIVATPAATPVTTPVLLPTVAIAVFDDDHEIVDETTVPAEFSAEALRVMLDPTATDVAFPVIDTLATVWFCVPVG